MIRQRMKLKRFFNIIFSLAFLTAGAQNVTQTVQIADRFMETGRFSSAAKYYQRAYFFADKKDIPLIRGKMADAFFMKHDFQRAAKYYDQAVKFETDDTLRSEWFLKKISAEIMQKKFNLALLETLNYRGKFTPRQEKNKNFLLGTAYYGLEKFDAAKQKFLSALPENDSLHRAALNALFSPKNLNRPRPEIARWMSIFVPGLGQAYAGDWKNAANSFFLNGLLVWLMLRDMANVGFINAFVGVFPWLQRYYVGGYERAENIARQKRLEKRAKTFRKIKTLIYAR